MWQAELDVAARPRAPDKMMATLGRMGMIFVPSVSGISHSPRELTRWEDCVRGAEVLMETVLGWAG